MLSTGRAGRRPRDATMVARRVVRGQTPGLAEAAALSVLAALAELAAPWPVAFTVDHVIDQRPLPAGLDLLAGVPPTGLVAVVALILVLLSGGTALLEARAMVLGERSAERAVAELRRAMVDRALTLSPRWHHRMPTGELTSRLTGDTGRVGDTLVLAVDLVPDVVVLVGTLVLLLVIDPVLAVVALSVVPVLALAAVQQRRLVRRAEGRARTASGRLAASSGDVLRNTIAVQAFAQHRRASARIGEHVVGTLEASLAAIAVRARWAPRADVLLAIGTGSVLLFGIRRVLAGELSTGDLLVVIAYVKGLYRPVRSLARSWSALVKASVSWQRVADVLDCTERVVETVAPVRLSRLRDRIVLDQVGFGYRPDRPVLDRVDLEVRAGEVLCLVGPSGAGKSTVLALLQRLYDVDHGRITLDGIDLRRFALDDLRRRLALVPQDPWLLDATVAENIAFGASAPSDLQIVQAAREAGVEQFVRRLPQGYATPVGEGGVRLSVGQRRRVAIARGLVGDADVLLLDEPTASLDRASADVIVRAVLQAAVGRTVIMVSHDPALTSVADRVVTLGRVLTGERR